jgi:hypothetical protein
LLLGYLEFVALLFLPGIAFIELFGLGGDYSFAERLGLAFGLSMSVDVLVLAFRTTGLLVGSQLLVGIFPGTLEIMLAASVVAFAAAVGLKRKANFYVNPTRYDLLVLGLVLVQAVLVLVHFSKYPIFPEFPSVDFGQHVEITAALQSGELAMFPGGLLYYGVHLLMGSLVALSGDLVLEATQYAMGLLTVFSPLLVFAAVNSLAQSKRIGLIATLLYVGTGFVWFGSVFDAGLYANFYGIMSILLLFALVPAVLKQPRSPGVWVAFLLALGSGYLSHYSFLTILPALVALPIVVLVLERKIEWPSIAIPAIVIIPALAAAALRPDLVSLLVGFIQAQGGGSITGDTSLSQLLAGWPVLRFVVVEMADDLGAFVTLVLAALGVYVVAKSRNPFAWMVIVWLVALLVVAPISEAAWRFSYMAFVPLLIVASVGFDRLVPRPADRSVRRSKMRGRGDYKQSRRGLLVLVAILLFVNSWSWQLVGDAASTGAENSQTQQGVLKSMQWMNSNLPPGARVVSVTYSDYGYYQLIFGKPAGYAPLAPPDTVVASLNGSSTPTYVVLTTVGTVTVPDPSRNPFSLYPADARFEQVYNDTGVVIYKLAH